MPIRTSCSSCQATYTVADSLLGQKVRCKKCEATFTVQPVSKQGPAKDDGSRSDRPATASPRSSAPARRPRDDEDEDQRRPSRHRDADQEEDRPLKPVRGRRDEEEDSRSRRGRGRADDDPDDRPRTDRRIANDRSPARRPRDDEEDNRRRPARGRDDEDADDRLLNKGKRTAGGSALPLVLGGVGVLLVLLLLGGGGVWWALSRSSNPGPQAGLNPFDDEKGGDQKPPTDQPDKKPEDKKKEPRLLPAALTADDLVRVKKATVQAGAELPAGGVSQGTGFFAVEPGVIITNAHVLGMLTADGLPPKSVSVIVHSGESSEFKVNGIVLGVDRANDLAVLRADATGGPLPPPLEVDSAVGVIETQKVYIFGFPFAAKLGKNITVSESSVTSLRQKDGVLHQVQVKGGMNPGNSGGPVTDTRGVVVGVSVAILRGTEISFAIPGDYVRRILAGGISSMEYGTPFAGARGQPHLPVRLTTLDPLLRMREVKLEVWSGPAGEPLPAGEQEPKQRPGESARQRVAATARGQGFTADVPLPTLPANHVFWVQPVTAGAGGSPRWASAQVVPFDPNTVIERKPANLTFKPPTTSIERTVRITSNKTVNIVGLDEPVAISHKMDAYALEMSGPDGKQPVTRARLKLHRPRFTREMGGKVLQAPPSIALHVDRLSPSYLITPDHSVKTFVRPGLVGVPVDLQETVQDLFDTVCNSYEVTTIPLPNRLVQPQESWPAKVPMLISTGAPRRETVRIRGRIVTRTVPSRKEARHLNLTCTYEGTRVVDGTTLGYVQLTGVVNGVLSKAKDVYGTVSGHALVNLNSGMLSRVKTSIRLEMESEDTDVRILVNNESTMDRVEGNTQGITPIQPPQPPQPVKPPDPPAITKGPQRALKVISGDVYAFVAQALKDKRVSEVDLSGNRLGKLYVEVPPEGALLIGFEVAEGKVGPTKVIHGLRAIYQTKIGEKFGAWQGKTAAETPSTVTLKAKPGYVVAGAQLRVGITIDGISLTYRKLDKGQLDEKDSYKSDWAGNTMSGSLYSLGGQGIFFVGITGHVLPTGQTSSLGLITVLSPRGETTPVAAEVDLREKTIDVGDLKVTSLKLPAKDLVKSLVFSPDGKWLYTIEERGTLHKIETATWKRTLTNDLGEKCTWLAMSKEGLVATMKDAHEVWVIDPDTLKPLRRIATTSVVRTAASPLSSLAVAGCQRDGLVLDLKEGKEVAKMNGRLSHPTLSPDGKMCYAQSGIAELHAFALSPTGLSPSAKTGRIARNGQDVVVSPDGKFVCLPAGGGNGGKPHSTHVFAATELGKPAFVMESGAIPRTVGFDAKSPLAYAMNHMTQLMIYGFDGKMKSEYKLPGEGATKSFTPHPEGRRVLVLTDKALFDVKLPPE